MKVALDDILFHKDGSCKEILVELSESAGPVSPEYQYDLSVKLSIENGSPQLIYKREYPIESAEKANHAIQKNLDKKIYKSMMKDLLLSGNFSKSVDLIDSKRDRIGVSFNYLTIVIDSKKFRLDYLLSDKEKKEFGFANTLQVIEKWSDIKDS